MVDLAPFQLQLAALVADVEATPAAFSLSGLKRWGHLAFLKAMQSGVAELGVGRVRLTWADLVHLTKTQLLARSGVLFGGLRLALHTAAWTNVYMAVMLIGLCHAVTFAVFFLAFRPAAPGPRNSR